MLNNKRKKLLLIDDNPIDLKINSKLISILGLFDEIVVRQSGEAALSYLQENADKIDKLPDFILLDIQMPEMNGFEFLKVFKEFPKELKEKCLIAILSSTLDFGDLKKAEANPYVTKLIKKPLCPDELEELLKKYSLA